MVYNRFDMSSAKPFLKWAGGKTQLLDKLFNFLPKFSNYHEPFVGGGALFFYLSKKSLINQAHLYDYNQELVNAYNVIKHEPLKLLEELSASRYANNKEAFLDIRASESTEPITRAARLLYLNKTAFNGLYRVNSKGKFNVPFGKYGKLALPSKTLLLKDSESLQSAEMHVGDFSDVLHFAKKGDLVYFDPPYQPRSKTSNFTSYTAKSFSENDQVRLADVFAELDKRGCYVMLSNSSTELIKTLYSNYYIEEVLASRAINCKPEGRGKIKEFIVRNWKPKIKQIRLAHAEEVMAVEN